MACGDRHKCKCCLKLFRPGCETRATAQPFSRSKWDRSNLDTRRQRGTARKRLHILNVELVFRRDEQRTPERDTSDD